MNTGVKTANCCGLCTVCDGQFRKNKIVKVAGAYNTVESIISLVRLGLNPIISNFC